MLLNFLNKYGYYPDGDRNLINLVVPITKKALQQRKPPV